MCQQSCVRSGALKHQWGKGPLFDELAAQLNTQWVVHVEHVDCNAANGRTPHDVGAIQTEMVGPLVPAGMKKRCQLSGVWAQPGQIWPLALIAPQTGESQIAQDGTATVLPGNDMLDFEGDRLYEEFPRVILLRKQTVLTSMSSPLTNDLCQLIHVWVTTPGSVLRPSELWTARWPEYHQQ
jgi:hypothetical protein